MSSASSSSSPPSFPVPSDPVELGKRAAARAAVDAFVRSNQKLGIGSGSTIVYAVQRIAELSHSSSSSSSSTLTHLRCVPTSFQARSLILEHGLSLHDLSELGGELDLAIDGSDEVDAELNCIKGGGACMLQEKIVAAAAKEFVVIADSRKDSEKLGQKWKQGIPLEVVPMAYVSVLKAIERLGGKPTLRMAVKKAGPVVTDNGNFVVDADFGVVETKDVEGLNVKLSLIPGIVETGLFVKMAKKAYFGGSDGKVVERERK